MHVYTWIGTQAYTCTHTCQAGRGAPLTAHALLASGSLLWLNGRGKLLFKWAFSLLGAQSTTVLQFLTTRPPATEETDHIWNWELKDDMRKTQFYN